MEINKLCECRTTIDPKLIIEYFYQKTDKSAIYKQQKTNQFYNEILSNNKFIVIFIFALWNNPRREVAFNKQ